MDLAPNTTQQPAKFHLLHVPFSKTYLACAQQNFITGLKCILFSAWKTSRQILVKLEALEENKGPVTILASSTHTRLRNRISQNQIEQKPRAATVPVRQMRHFVVSCSSLVVPIIFLR